MNRLFQIVEMSGSFYHAGSKATADIAAIAEGKGFRRLPVRMDTTADTKLAKLQRQRGYLRDWHAADRAVRAAGRDAVVLLQHPFHYPQLTRERTLRRWKQGGCRFICLVHDVEELRGFRYNEYYRREFAVMLELADALIVHNAAMARFFAERGVPEHKLVRLEVFDYLQPRPNTALPAFSRCVTVAGNLDVQKCGYIGELAQLSGVELRLFGPNFPDVLQACPHIRYGGCLSPEELPQRLTAGFGLVWDGSSIDGCRGPSGRYLRYNNPHKLSLYLSSGLPVVIWSQAAEAAYVRQHGVGLCVDTLTDLCTALAAVTAEDYAAMAQRVQGEQSRLLAGHYAARALDSALQMLQTADADER